VYDRRIVQEAMVKPAVALNSSAFTYLLILEQHTLLKGSVFRNALALNAV